MDFNDSEENDQLTPTFRIRLTIGNRKNSDCDTNTPSGSEHRANQQQESQSLHQNDQHCNHTSFIRQDETDERNRQIGANEDFGTIREYVNITANRRSNNNNPLTRRKAKSFRFVEPQNHKSALFVNLCGTTKSQSVLDSQSQDNCNYYEASDKQIFISPDLNQTIASRSSLSSPSPTSSPTLSTTATATTTTPEATPKTDHSLPLTPDDSTLDSSSYELIEGDSSLCNSLCQPKLDTDGTMSQNCNFINWMSATKRCASSATPSAQATNSTTGSSDTIKDLTTSTTASAGGDARRALSSDGLHQLSPGEGLLLASSNGPAGGNQLTASDSVETVCDQTDQTQTNSANPLNNGRFPPYANIEVGLPLEIDIQSPSSDEFMPPLNASIHPVSLDAILQIDMDNLRFEGECRALEAQAQYWEQRVEELERKQFADDVPRTLVENIIKHRKELRDLEFQLFKSTIDSDDSDLQSCEGKLSQRLNLHDDYDYQDDNDGDSSPNDHFHHHHSDNRARVDSQAYLLDDNDRFRHQDRFITNFNDLSGHGGGHAIKSASKFGSEIKPGQENTAEILDAVPPSGSLQQRQYLNKASSATDTSDYSQLPSFDQHKHRIVRHPITITQTEELASDGDRTDYLPRRHHHRQHRSHHHHHHHHQQQQQQQQHQIYQQQNHHYHQQSSQRVSRRQASNQRQLYVQQLESSSGAPGDYKLPPPPTDRVRSSPIRPNHFKGEFRSPRVIVAQDSSSTASSSSPQ